MKECLFCQLATAGGGLNPANKLIYQDKFFYLRFDDLPVSPGHLQIIPVKHLTALRELSNEEWIAFKPLLEKAVALIDATDLKDLYEKFLAGATNEKFKFYAAEMLKRAHLHQTPAGYNIGINEGEAAGQTFSHLHIHIIPRYQGDVADPTGGVRNLIPYLGDYKKIINKP